MTVPRIDIEHASLDYRLDRNRAGTFKEAILNLTHRRVTREKLRALDDISIVVRPGEVLGVIGPNGAGKSTLMKLIARVLPPTSGRVIVRGSVAAMIALGAGFNPELTARENVTIYGTLLGRTSRDMRSRFGDIIRWAELEDFADVPTRAFSTGMLARLGFAVATDSGADVLVVDEVLSVGDAAFKKKSMERMEGLIRSGSAVVFVSHALDTVENFCDRVIWLDHGRIVREGDASEVITAYKDSINVSQPDARSLGAPRVSPSPPRRRLIALLRSAAKRIAESGRNTPELYAALSLLPLVTWWTGFYPGFFSDDSIDQLSQVVSGSFQNYHPVTSTWLMWAASMGGRLPGLIPLIQILAFWIILMLLVRQMTMLGVPPWIAIFGAWLTSGLPAVGATTITVWKDVPFGLAFLWLFTELISNRGKEPNARSAISIGSAASLLWLLRPNGWITVGVFAFGAAIAWRRRPKGLLIAAGTVLAAVSAVTFLLQPLLGVEPSDVEPAEVFLADVAASFNAEPNTFTAEDLDLLDRVAPLSVWNSAYDCHENSELLFNPEFRHGQIYRDPSTYRSLVARVALRDPDSVLAHRICASSYLFWPPQPQDAYFHRPPYDIPANNLGLTRDPISWKAHAVVDWIFRQAEPDSRLWISWRPGLITIAALGSLILLTGRRDTRWFWLPAWLFVAHLANVALTSPSQEFRYAYPLYLAGIFIVVTAIGMSRTSTRQSGDQGSNAGSRSESPAI